MHTLSARTTCVTGTWFACSNSKSACSSARTAASCRTGIRHWSLDSTDVIPTATVRNSDSHGSSPGSAPRRCSRRRRRDRAAC
eukprot:70208-Prymnesium_polylepis.2